MDAPNLSICIGSNVFPDTIQTLGESVNANIALEVMIRKDDFAANGFLPDDLCTDDDIAKLLR